MSDKLTNIFGETSTKPWIMILAERDQEIKKLKEENEKLKSALAFYADKDNWQDLNKGAPSFRKMVASDHEKLDNAMYSGKLAREVLRSLK